MGLLPIHSVQPAGVNQVLRLAEEARQGDHCKGYNGMGQLMVSGQICQVTVGLEL